MIYEAESKPHKQYARFNFNIYPENTWWTIETYAVVPRINLIYVRSS